MTTLENRFREMFGEKSNAFLTSNVNRFTKSHFKNQLRQRLVLFTYFKRFKPYSFQINSVGNFMDTENAELSDNKLHGNNNNSVTYQRFVMNFSIICKKGIKNQPSKGHVQKVNNMLREKIQILGTFRAIRVYVAL